MITLYVALSAVFAFVYCGDKRELPLNYNCNPNIGTCSKADLISTSVADCEKDSILITCTPKNDFELSSVVDVPVGDVSCNPVGGLPIQCGTKDTRCVCDKAVDYKRPKETFFNQCRCQYWPATDVRSEYPSYCTQYDHGGVSSIHFFTCCDNRNDNDVSCAGTTYQGGGSTDAYCGNNGLSSSLGGGRITYRFNCVNCAQQTACEAKCDAVWPNKNIPGFCPKWAGCFRGCCVEADRKYGNRNKRDSIHSNNTIDFEFCGDLICQSGEDVDNCPIDCCSEIRPSCNSNCTDLCCYEPGCCVADNGDSGSYAITTKPLTLLLMFTTMLSMLASAGIGVLSNNPGHCFSVCY